MTNAQSQIQQPTFTCLDKKTKKEKKIWFFKRNESYGENQFFSPETIKILFRSEWNLQNMNSVLNIKRSLLQIYKKYEYCDYGEKEYESMKKETDEFNDEVLCFVKEILKQSGIEMLLYNRYQSQVYDELRQISEMFFCSFFQTKLLCCLKIQIEFNEESNLIDQLMEDEIEQSFFQQQIIEILSENGIHAQQISFICLEKAYKVRKTQHRAGNKQKYILYFDIIDNQMCEGLNDRYLSFGRRLFNPASIKIKISKQFGIQHKFVKVAVFDRQLYFSLAKRLSAQENTQQIVYRITGAWEDNIEDVQIAKQNQLYCNEKEILEMGNNNLQITTRKKKESVKAIRSIMISDIEYEYFIKIQKLDDNSFNTLNCNSRLGFIDIRSIDSQMMQIILIQKYSRTFYDFPNSNSNQQENNNSFHATIAGSVNFTQINQIPQNNENYLMNNRTLAESLMYITKAFGLADIDTIIFRKQQEYYEDQYKFIQQSYVQQQEQQQDGREQEEQKEVERQISEFNRNLNEYYFNKRYRFYDFTDKLLKYHLSNFYQFCRYLPTVPYQNYIEELIRDDTNLSLNEGDQQPSQSKRRQRRINQIKLIQDVCMKKDLLILQDKATVQNILKTDAVYAQYKLLQSDELTFIENILIHLFSIYRAGNIFKCYKVIFNIQKDLQHFNLQQANEQNVLTLLSMKLNISEDFLQLYRFKQDNDIFIIYFDPTNDKSIRQTEGHVKSFLVQSNVSLIGNFIILPSRILKTEKNDVINLTSDIQSKFTLTYYPKPVAYNHSKGQKIIYAQFVGEQHESKLSELKEEKRYEQSITFLERQSHIKGDTSYLRDLILHLNENQRKEEKGRQLINPIIAKSRVFGEDRQNLELGVNNLLHQTDIQNQIRLKGFYLKPKIKDVHSQYKYFEFNCEGVYDPDWWLTGWPMLYRSVYDKGDQKNNFLFSDDPYYLLNSNQEQLKNMKNACNRNIFYICSIDPRYDNFQLIASNHITKIPFYYSRVRCLIVLRDGICSIF